MGMSSSRLGSSRNLRRLKWSSIVLPLLFVGATSYVGHFVFPSYLNSLGGFLVLLATLAAGIFVFSRFVFTRVERAEHQARSRNQEMLILKTVAAASQPMKLPELLQIAVDGVVEATGVDGGLACVLDERQRELLHVAYRGIPEDLLGPLKKVKLEKVKLDDDPIAATVVSTGEPVQVRDLSQDPRIGETGRKSGFCSVISLPLKSEGKVKGVMALVTRFPNVFESSQVQFLLTLGGNWRWP